MNCSGNGICNRGSCLCVDGYQGRGCQDTISSSHTAEQSISAFMEVESTFDKALQPHNPSQKDRLLATVAL
jgi:hypothetical protein